MDQKMPGIASEDANVKNTTLSNGATEIAIIGMGCRFPKDITNPDNFWDSLLNGVDGISDVPQKRWDVRKFYDEDKSKPGKMYTKQAGFLSQDLEEYDPLFFGISPREADVIDPMQRLLMEVAWEAVEHAGLTAEKLKAVKTGVFVGGFALDNKVIQLDYDNRSIINPTSAVGITLALLSNRLSYVFDLTGPSLSIDTACSSSMVATHYAIQSMRNGDCEMAMVGGANTMLTPGYPVAMCKGQFLSHHARCKAFSNDAAGYVRAEGAGILILKPLEKAKADGDVIHAVIIESGVNQDGGQTNGISLPNPVAQEALIKEVYARAGVSPKALSYMEAHGTGTKAGDPIELKAITRAMGDRAVEDTCYVGSVKSNIGHMEACSAVAGIMKAALTAKNKRIPPNLHFNTPNEAIPFDEIPLKVPTACIELDKDREHFVGVNSFGYGGTNGHVLLRSPKADEVIPFTAKTDKEGNYLVPISAKSTAALADLAKRYALFLQQDMAGANQYVMEDIIYSLAERRTQHPYRLVFRVASKNALLQALLDYADGKISEDMVEGKSLSGSNKKTCFVFSGMGPQWWKMGQELYKTEPVYRDEVDKIDSVFKDIIGWSILEEMMKDEDASQMEMTTIAQPANFVIQAGLAKLWQTWGVEPDCVIGHSVGEVSSAYISGAISLEEAVVVSAKRSAQQKRCAGMGGAMLAVGLSEADALKRIADCKAVSIAAINSYSAVTLSGDVKELEAVAAVLSDEGVFNRFLKVDIAYHSAQMDPVLDDLKADLADLQPKETQLPLFSTVTGKLIDGKAIDAQYWADNVRDPVRFVQGIEAVLESGDYHFIEVGPHPVLRNSVKECLDARGVSNSAIVSTLNRKMPEQAHFYQAVASFHTAGGKIAWHNFFAEGGQFIPLPLYPWQREHYWHETEISIEKRIGRSGYVYLNELVRSPIPAWKMEVNKYMIPYLEDHQVENMVVFPGAGYIDIALALHEEQFKELSCSLENVKILKMLAVQPGQVPVIQSSIDPESREFRIYSRDQSSEVANWMLHASGSVNPGTIRSEATSLDISALREEMHKELDVATFYSELDERGLSYGHYFQPIRKISRSSHSVLAEIEPVMEVLAGAKDYLLHPTILDASFQSLIALLDSDQPYVPVSFERMDFFRSPRRSCLSYGKITHRDERAITCDIQLLDEMGNVLVDIRNLVCNAIGAGSDADAAMEKWLYEFEWNEAESAASDAQLSSDLQVLLLAKDDALSSAIVSQLDELGVNYALFTEARAYKKTGINKVAVNPGDESQLKKALAVVNYMSINRVIDLWSTDVLSEADCNTENTTLHAMKMRNMLSAMEGQTQQMDWIKVTRAAQSMPSKLGAQNIAISPVLGLGPIVVNEFNHILCRMVDLDYPGDVAVEAQMLIAELCDESRESEVVYRGGSRFLRRVKRYEADTESTDKVSLESSAPLLAKPATAASEEAFEFFETERFAVTDDAVEVAVSQLSLDEGNILYSEYPGEAKLTYSCSGKVVNAGPASSYRIGDEVFALNTEGQLSNYLTLGEGALVAKPNGSYVNLMAFTCAFYSLRKLANISVGESVLIHDADTDFGYAAAAIASAMGAQVYVTTGQDYKNLSTIFSALNIVAAMDKNSLDFVDELHGYTSGKGVDLVLNCASGDVREKGFSVLASCGRMIDIATKANVNQRKVPAHVTALNYQYSSVHFGTWITLQPAMVRLCAKEVVSWLQDADIPAKPLVNFSAGELSSALEKMEEMHSRDHEAQVTLTFTDQKLDARITKMRSWLAPQASYVISGGTKGFGLTVAEQLAAYGAKQVVLLSRSGANSEEATSAIKRIEDLGCKVAVEAVDIADTAAVTATVKKFDTPELPIKGVFHCAGVLDDGPLLAMDEARFTRVIEPKMAGAWNLHHATLNLAHSEIELFVLFSSVSSMMGNPQQANYVVANSFFDNFAYYRRAQDLPSTVINWGALAETGMVARSKGVKDILQSQGIYGLSNAYALQQMDNALEQRVTQVGILDIEWESWFGTNVNSENSSRYEHLIETLDRNGDDEAANAFIQSLTGLTSPERVTAVENAIKQEISSLLRIPFDQIDAGNSLSNIGVDSIVTSELSNRLKKEYCMNVNTMMLLNSSSIAQLANQITNTDFATSVAEAA
ncbi:type I polyketide synthase [Teredinibacter turnerae]|uniref:type I polyketide synthase n=1 Tax=Teredinibacter turnerae TaxID=2426 RepID=UPI00035EE5E4|nr:type I polyketide synthase [Teredinibacter turnerae]